MLSYNDFADNPHRQTAQQCAAPDASGAVVVFLAGVKCVPLPQVSYGVGPLGESLIYGGSRRRRMRTLHGIMLSAMVATAIGVAGCGGGGGGSSSGSGTTAPSEANVTFTVSNYYASSTSGALYPSGIYSVIVDDGLPASQGNVTDPNGLTDHTSTAVLPSGSSEVLFKPFERLTIGTHQFQVRVTAPPTPWPGGNGTQSGGCTVTVSGAHFDFGGGHTATTAYIPQGLAYGSSTVALPLLVP